MEIMRDVFKRRIKGGLYLVVDPKPGISFVLPKINAALKGGIDIIQLWNNWEKDQSQTKFIKQVCNLAHQFDVPVIINENWALLKTLPLDGIHFDNVPKNWNEIKTQIDRPFLTGLTCGNDQKPIEWAPQNNLDYISFCSMFPSSTANSCELIKSETVCNTRRITSIPIFVAGGITRETIPKLYSLGINGIAVASAIMKAEDPEVAAKKFKELINNKTPAQI
jgi:thiamine-phosphate pyrophosphorylase